MTSVLDGFNVCIFAYGQSGSGKTHTMDGTKEMPGLAPRAMGRLFEVCPTHFIHSASDYRRLIKP